MTHKDWIDALGYEDLMMVSEDLKKGKGKVITCSDANFKPIKILKFLDKASPTLHLYAANGSNIPEVKIEVVRTGGDGIPEVILDIVLTDVSVKAISTMLNVLNGTENKEEVAFDFRRIQWTYCYYSSPGQCSEVKACWDCLTNSSCN